VSDTLGLEPFADKWVAFGWHVQSVNGHDHDALKAAYAAARIFPDQPSVVIANTIKGNGVSFMENNVLWHYRTPQGEEYEAAVAELEEKANA
jgi:transketolase